MLGCVDRQRKGQLAGWVRDSATQPALSALVPEGKGTDQGEGLHREGLTKGFWMDQALEGGVLQKPEASLLLRRRQSKAKDGNC